MGDLGKDRGTGGTGAPQAGNGSTRREGDTVFVGHHEHTLDEAGRLILPRPFRDQLADGAVVAPYGECLAVFPAAQFDAAGRRLLELVSAGEMDPAAMRTFSAYADLVRPDKQGRIRIHPRLQDLAHLDGEVVVTGALQHVEVWSPSRWEAQLVRGTPAWNEAVSRGVGFLPAPTDSSADAVPVPPPAEPRP
ncbi:MAG: hypothetical protein D6683_14830 [Actinomyces sp.]|nr:MAG: hypothetical protein D6683_14830 [Actinomyces sp.]